MNRTLSTTESPSRQAITIEREANAPLVDLLADAIVATVGLDAPLARDAAAQVVAGLPSLVDQALERRGVDDARGAARAVGHASDTVSILSAGVALLREEVRDVEDVIAEARASQREALRPHAAQLREWLDAQCPRWSPWGTVMRAVPLDAVRSLVAALDPEDEAAPPSPRSPAERCHLPEVEVSL